MENKTKEDKEDIIEAIYDRYYSGKITIDEVINQAYKAGFESFRERVEEGVKKQYLYSHSDILLQSEVLTTIREIKQ